MVRLKKFRHPAQTPPRVVSFEWTTEPVATKGMLAERSGLEMPAAFKLMRSHARQHNRRLAAVAEDVVLGRIDLFGSDASGP